MRAGRWRAVGCLVVLLAAGFMRADEGEKQGKAKDLIVGKWAPSDEKQKGVTIEFGKDGSVKINVKIGQRSQTLEGTYKLTDDNNLEYSLKDPNNPANKDTQRVKIKSLSKDELVILTSREIEETLKRVK